MPNYNQYAEALLEGRWQPTINLDKQTDGKYRAHWTDYTGTTVEHTDEISTYAMNVVQNEIRNGVLNGTLKPR